MNFIQRLKYYLIGVGLGILIVLAIFKDRKLTSWTPANQVLEELAEGEKLYSRVAECQLNCLQIPKDSLESLILNGKVDMSSERSSLRRDGQHLILLESDQLTSVEIELHNDSVMIRRIESKSSCDCDQAFQPKVISSPTDATVAEASMSTTSSPA